MTPVRQEKAIALDSRHPTDATPAEQMLALLNGHCLEQGLYVAAMLGIADLLDMECAPWSGQDQAATLTVCRAC
jgi:hypothetical protein